jgi:hypothetical protein
MGFPNTFDVDSKAAGVAGLNAKLAEIAGMKDPMMGGRRRRGSRKSRKAAKKSKKSRKSKKSKKSRKSRKSKKSRRSQRGGEHASASADSMLGVVAKGAHPQVNDFTQF